MKTDEERKMDCEKLLLKAFQNLLKHTNDDYLIRHVKVIMHSMHATAEDVYREDVITFTPERGLEVDSKEAKQ